MPHVAISDALVATYKIQLLQTPIKNGLENERY